ncbi:unnamed protein product [Ilex paraguariensis]|uniref:Uncharacterized protein n=1 Tax=Ilex paraguariensis TaxID=185542 RepID=A0ABC8UB88_9AQUA
MKQVFLFPPSYYYQPKQDKTSKERAVPSFCFPALLNNFSRRDKWTTKGIFTKENKSRKCVTNSPDEKSVSGKDSDRDNQSFNESISTQNRDTGVKLEPETVQTGDVTPDPGSDPKRAGEDSCNDSSTWRPGQEKKVDGDSVAESKEGTKESSDVQSSASLTRKGRRKGERDGGRGGDETVVVAGETTMKRETLVKSEPFVWVLDIIRSHKHGSIFERRFQSQVYSTTSHFLKITVHHSIAILGLMSYDSS